MTDWIRSRRAIGLAERRGALVALLLFSCLPGIYGDDEQVFSRRNILSTIGGGLNGCRPWMGWKCPSVAGERPKSPVRVDFRAGDFTTRYSYQGDRNPGSQDITGRSSTLFADGNYKRDIESVAAFWNSRPCNAGWKFPGVEFGTREWFEKVRIKKYLVEPHIISFADFPRWNGKNVLIIGGGLCTNAASFLEAGARVTVIDVSSESHKLCKKNLELRGLENFDLYNGNAEQLQAVIPPQKFDLIWSFGVIHHSPRPSAIMEQCRAFVKAGTEVRVMVYSKISFKLFEVLAANEKPLDLAEGDKLIEQYSEAQAGSPVTFTYTKNEAAALVAKSGATVTSVWKDHIFPYNITHYKQNEYKVVDYLQNVHGTPAFDELEAELGWHTMVKAVVLRELA